MKPLRIEFITQDDPIYILPLFEEFVRHHSEEAEIISISCCKVMGRRSRRQLARELIELYGILGFVRLLGRVASSRVLGILPRRTSASSYLSLSQLCRAYHIEFHSIQNPNSPEFLAQAAARRSDLIVSVACPYILKQPLLAMPRLGCINIHHAPLPQYRGMMPTFWQLYHGESSVGLTIHSMGEKIDEGSALLQERLAIEKGETLDRLIRRSKRHAAHCLARVLRALQANSAVCSPLGEEGASYFTFPSSAEIREFQRRGLRAI